MPAPDAALADLAEARERTLALVEPLSEEDLERVHSPLMSPLVWDLGHIAAFEDLWIGHRLGGEPLLRPDLARVYDAFESPRRERGHLPFLRTGACRAYMEEVRERTLEMLGRRDTEDSVIPELVVRHEHQHTETMLQTLQLARLEGYAPPEAAEPPAAPASPPAPSGRDLVLVEGGRFRVGADEDGFAYDNERPRHVVELGDFLIGRVPVTNGDYEEFVAAGGYDREEWWSAPGWAWRHEERAGRPANWTDDGAEWRLGRLEERDPAKPVIHVSYFEAQACAHAFGARLPVEQEWERAAPEAPVEGNFLEERIYGPAPAGAYPAGAAGCGALGMLGDVWEWTASEFGGYAGFRPDPYREYSEPFFGDGYQVLRGGSWATTSRVAQRSHRNWDLPQRRQIFAGFRLARDGARPA